MIEKKLGLLSGTSYAIGSIIGSGILFLPSLTYKLSGSNVFLSWLLATLLCIPLLIIFYDMSKISPSNDGIKGFIELGLGKFLGLCFPVLMLSTVSIGMPSSALIVGKYAREYFQISSLEYIVAIYLVFFGIASNVIGKNFGEKVQNAVSVIFFIVGILLFTVTTPKAIGGYDRIIPDFNFTQAFSGLTMAFWAFAGFENLTFIVQDFKNPKRDFLLSMVIALFVCGLLYLGVTANYAAIIPLNEVQTVMGIFQLSQVVEPKAVSGLVIVFLALFALKTNFNSWIRGLSSMIRASASTGSLPKSFGDKNRPFFLLGTLFSLTLTLSYIFPSFLETGLVIVSSNFVLIYVMCIISYLKITKSLPRKIMAFLTLGILLFSLSTSGLKLLYPLGVMTICYLFYRVKFNKALASFGVIGLILFSVQSYGASKEVSVALIFRYGDKFNGTTRYLDRGIELAQKVFEKEKGIKLNLKRYPHNEKLSSVIEATQKAVDDGHFIIVGGENSDEAMAIAETIKDKNIVFITPTSTNPKVTSGRPYVFRTCISDDKVSDKLAQFIYEKVKPKSVGILHNVSYPYSDYLSRRYLHKSQELVDKSSNSQSQRMKVSVKKIIRNQSDYSQEIKHFKDQGITHLIVLSFQSDLLRFQSQASAEGLNPIYIGSDGWGLNEAVYNQIIKNKTSGAKFIGLRNVYWDGESDTSSNRKFKKDFKNYFGDVANPWSAITYDTMTIIVESSLSIKGKLEGKALRDAIKNYRGKNLLTTSDFVFDDSNTPNQEVVIYQIDNKGIGYYGKI